MDQFLTRRLKGYSRRQVQEMIETARVTRDERSLRASSKVRTKDRIHVSYPRQPESSMDSTTPLPVLWEDEFLVIVNKPSGLLSHPTDKVVTHTVTGYMAHHRPDLGPLHLLHRLDRETSGVLALAKNALVAREWTKAMQAHAIEKRYLALAHGCPHPRSGTIRCPIGAENGLARARQWVHVSGAVPAVSDYEVVSTRNGIAAVRIWPKTGRLHQIRVHLASIGHPLLGDPLYNGQGEWFLKMVEGALTADDRATLGFPRVALHADRLCFAHPRTSKKINVQAPYPADFQTLFATQRLKAPVL